MRELNEELGCAVAVDKLLSADVLEVVPAKLVLIIAYQCLLLSPIAEFKLSEEHKECRLFSASELRQAPIPEVYVNAVNLASRK